MKQKRVVLIAMIFALLAVLWVFILQQFLKIDQIKEQNEFVAAADAFAEKELYVRAIDSYQEALKINTTDSKKNKIEAKLLKAYLKYGDKVSYQSLVESRMKKGTAKEGEIAKMAQMYADSYLFSDAMDSLEAGLEMYPDSEKLVAVYDSVRFLYSLNYITVDEIKTDDETGKYAVCEDGKWFYINSSGNLSYKVTFDEATPFYKDSEGNEFAVIKSEGKYYVVNEDCALYGRDDTGVEEVLGIAADHVIAKKDGKYGFYNYEFESSSDVHQYDLITLSSNGLIAVQNGDKWGIISDGGETIIPIELNDVAINSVGQAFRGGNAMVKRGKTWEMVDMKGEKVGQDTYADAKAPEATGLIAVANEKSKWGFIDRTGKLVIDYQYDDAYSFSDDVAVVKTSQGWNYINEKNEIIIDEDFSEAMPFHSGCAIAKNDDSYLIITFDNYR